MQEVWKDIRGYEGLYQVSNLGNVKSINYHREGIEKILKAGKNPKGYLIVSLFKNGKSKNHKVHRLVAEAFIPNPENKPEVNHKDTNKLNNKADNLEWNTNKENIRHSWDMGVNEQRRELLRKRSSKKVLQYDLQGNFIKEWESVAEVERQIKINDGNISSCCRGKLKTAGGFIWRFKT